MCGISVLMHAGCFLNSMPYIFNETCPVSSPSLSILCGGQTMSVVIRSLSEEAYTFPILIYIKNSTNGH